ncbi:response regulator [Pseudoalteromonas sp. MMG010]|nr:response regulator [Pseudoalteromonas sp. MMG010]
MATLLDIISNIRNRYRWALLAIALLISASAILLQYCFSVQSYDAKIINMAGKQRMLVQKIAWHANTLLTSTNFQPQHAQSLKEALNTFITNHHYLLSKNKSGEYIFLTSELKSLYFSKATNLNAGFVYYSEQATSVLNNQKNSTQAFTIKHVDALINQLDEAVTLFEVAATNKVNWVSNIELGCWFFAILLLMFEVKFVFLPMEKAVEKHLIKYKKQKEFSQQVSKNKDHFISRASHEFRTPLQGLISSIENLTVSEQQQNVKKEAAYCALRLYSMLDELQDLQTLSQGNWQLKPYSDNLKNVFEQALIPLIFDCDRKKLKLSVTLADELNTDYLLDHHRFKQVLCELIINAIKFTEQGEISITAKVDKNRLAVSICDTGPGFEYEIKNLNESATEQSSHFQGLRTGLTRVQYIVNAFDGKINFENNTYGGALITLTLPIKVPNQKITTHTPKVIKYALIVEDNTLNTMLLKRILDLLNLSYDCAENGEVGCQMALKNKYDIIFMDLNMPVMDGYQAIHVIRNKLKQSVPIIVVTANTSEQDIKRAYECGASEHIYKPINKQIILSALKNLNMAPSKSINE